MEDRMSLPLEPDREEAFGAEWGLLKRARRKVRMGLRDVVSGKGTGTHILICGFPRSGTTMLQSMVEWAWPTARKYVGEMSGERALAKGWSKEEVWGSDGLLVTKTPADLLCLHRLEKWHTENGSALKVIAVARDPRDVLVSHHKGFDREYYMLPRVWKLYCSRFMFHRDDPEVMVVRYEDLVSDVPGVQAEVEAFVGRKAARPFEGFYRQEHSEFVAKTLNGVRPVDRSSVGRWRDDRHRDRIEQVMSEVPSFGDDVVKLGYEADAEWVERWRAYDGSEAGRI